MPRRPRKLNIARIKANAMFALSLPFAFASGVTGIGAQVAEAPMSQFMLGFSAEKAAGTALLFGLTAAVGALVGAGSAGARPDLALILLVALGATVGTMLVSRWAQSPRLRSVRRTGQLLAAFLALFLARDALHAYAGGVHAFSIPFVASHGALSAFLLAVAVGALSGLTQVTIGVLLVPLSLYVLALADYRQAILLSLGVLALAALLPLAGYRARGLIDERFALPVALAGALGGLVGGLLLARLGGIGSTAPLVVFGLCAMFLSSWSLWKPS